MGTESPYWNPKTETLDREGIEALQLAKLQLQVEWAAARSPWYRRGFAAQGFEVPNVPGGAQTTEGRRPPVRWKPGSIRCSTRVARCGLRIGR